MRDDGGAIRFRQASLPGLAFGAVDFAVWTGLCGGLICAAVDPRCKRFGDLMARTIAIRTRATRINRGSWVPTADELPAGWR